MKFDCQKIPLGQLLTRTDEMTDIVPSDTYREVTIRLWGKGVTLRQEIKGDQIAASRRFLVRQNQFILSRIDARNGAFGLVPPELDGAIVSNDFPSYNIASDRLLPSFLGWLCRTRNFVSLCQKASEGSTNRVRLKENQFLAMSISLPPLSEQRRIVAKIDQLAQRINEAKRIKHQSTALVPFAMRAQLNELSEKLSINGQLSDVLTEKPRNGWSARCDNADNGTPVLALSAVTGFAYDGTAIKRTSEPTQTGAHYWLHKGDFLITRSNTPELVGHAAIYNGQPSPCIFPDLIMRVPVNESVASKRFVWYWLQSPVVRDYIQKNAKGTSPTMKKIAQGTVMSIPFPTSLPLSEQHRIVVYLDGMQSKVDTLKEQQAKSSVELDALLPSILDRAFKGEL